MLRAVSVCVAVAIWSASVTAQPIPAGRQVGLVPFLRGAYGGVKNNLMAAAAKMPEADYGYRPGTMPEVRTYGQLFGHVAEGQFDVCSAAKGVPNPNQGRMLERELTSKAQIIKALEESFAWCDDAFSTLTEANASEFVKRGKGEIVKSALLVGLLAHGAEMYGISTVYLRAKNIVPPSSER